MKKKSFNFLAYIPVAVLAVTTIGGFTRLQVQAENTRTKVEKIEEKVEEIDKESEEDIKEVKEKNKNEIEEIKKDNQEIEKGLTEMRVQQMYIQKSVDNLNENLF